MGLHQRKMSRKSIKHTAPNTVQHAKDVAQARQLENKRQRIIVASPAQALAPLTKAPCLTGHGQGWQYIMRGDDLEAVPEDVFIAHHEEIRQTRTHYLTERFDKKLNRNRTTKRKLDRESPLSQFALTLSPPLGATLKKLEQMNLNNNDQVRASEITWKFLDQVGKEAVTEYQKITGRIVTGLGVHLDTQCPHFHLPNTRIDESLKLCGDKGQGTSGSLFVIYRELQLGIIASKSARAVDFFAKMEQYESQRGRIPVDIQMVSFIDKKSEQVLLEMFPGEEQDIRELLQEAKDDYRRERKQQDATALNNKEQELLADLAAVRHEKELDNIPLPTPVITLPTPSTPSV